MADYSGGPSYRDYLLEDQRKKAEQEYLAARPAVTAKEKQLMEEIRELKAQVKELKGIHKYTVDIFETFRYEVEAGSAEEARQKVLDEHKLIEPKWSEITEVTVEYG